MADIGHDEHVHDVTYENSQARERTQILMDLANQVGGFVVGTGDLSELALGWATFNGDHMSMYHVNAGVPKTLVRYLIEWTAESEYSGEISEVLRDICATPITPELLPLGDGDTLQQETEATIGPYLLHDFFLFQVSALWLPAAQSLLPGTHGIWRHLHARRHLALAEDVLSTLFLTAIQTLRHARWAKGRHRGALARVATGACPAMPPALCGVRKLS